MKSKPVTSRPRHADMMIKVCGMREPDNIAAVAALTPMLMGFIFHGGSPRDATGLSPDAVKALPHFIRPVGVFVDRSVDEITDTCSRYGIKIVQLHGSETPATCRRLKDEGFTVFKAIGISDRRDLENAAVYDESIDMFVFDTKSRNHGGTGRKFDWQVLDSYPLLTPYLLSGGIGPDDIDNIIGAMSPGMAGIDINSRFETAPGHKEISLLVNFILQLRKFNEHEPDTKPFWEKKI